MKFKFILTNVLLLIMLAIGANAQWLPTANLTIFSEDGQPFYLILNGERQNDKPETNIRVEELPQPYYNCKIIFEDKKFKDISKNMLMVVDADGVPQDVTYRIKMDKKGTPVLRFHSFIPAEQNMMRPGNCSVYRFGNHTPFIMPGAMPAQQPVGRPMPGNTSMQQTTTIQTTTVNPGVGVNVNVPGVNMNVNIVDPLAPAVTTTTTTRSITTQQNVFVDDRGVQQGWGPCNMPMNNRDFSNALQAIQSDAFDETRLSTAQQVISSNCLSAQQIVSICNLFSFEETRLNFAKYAYEYCSDRNNYFQVNKVFNFDSSRQELNRYITGR